MSQLAKLAVLCSSAGLPANAYNFHFDTTPDYMNIGAGVSANLGDNYYVVIGDWGGRYGCASCAGTQVKIATLLQQYVAARKAQNPNGRLLFVLTVGDNFYWTGANGNCFQDTWASVYGPELTSVPWFATMGNHDWGDSDNEAACPERANRFVCNDANKNTPACGGNAPYSTETQYYASNQLDANKGGIGGDLRKNFNMPDFAYFYDIPQLSLEILAADYNWYQRCCLGGNGVGGGAGAVASFCGGAEQLYAKLQDLSESSHKLVQERGAATTMKNVAIISHYPDSFQAGINLRTVFGAAGGDAKGAKVFNFYGHTHVQSCINKNAAGECVDYLTGGSGGCCGTGDLPAGFVAISFRPDAQGKPEQFTECFAPDQRCTIYTYGTSNSTGPADVCSHTRDAEFCPNYHGGGDDEEVIV